MFWYDTNTGTLAIVASYIAKQMLCTLYDKTFEGKKFCGSYPKLNTQGKLLRLSKNCVHLK